MIKFQASIVFDNIWKALNEKEVNESGQLVHVYKLIIEEGSSRSTKTWSNFQALFLYLYENPITSATILRDTQKSCRDIVEKDWKEWLKDPMTRKKQYERGEITIDEFDRLIKEENLNQYFIENKTNHTWTFKHNGNMLRFTGLDDEDDAMGMTQTICWINEPYRFSIEVYRQLAMRSKIILFDWNPKQKHWVENEKLKKTTFVNHSTFRDNPFILPEVKAEILSKQPVKWSFIVQNKILTEPEAKYYDCVNNPQNLEQKHVNELARCQYNEAVNSADEYHWLVFGLGLKSEAPRKIYKNAVAITLEEYESIDKREYMGLDFGWSAPSAFVKVKFDGDNTFYVKPCLYKPINQMNGSLGDNLIAAGAIQGQVTYGWADNNDKKAGSSISLIKELREIYKMNFYATSKPGYLQRWDFLKKFNIRYVQNADFEDEIENYQEEYIGDMPLGVPAPTADHYMNSFEYCCWGIKQYEKIVS